ncbi:hypothetical protein WR25_13008 [Diploscapter pachys]|uniref:PCI domain-containing protein n=1 Tax=Diploscapter pachys TaxID=2018661 RepID=A0A2A2L1I6_9BILA|nr:hypothetical protein WR25_13008 [Diploscapter pachys]
MIALIHTVKKDFTDTRLYSDLFDQLEAYVKQNGSENVQLPVKDMAWLEKTTVANSQRLDALQTEYKRQRDEGVKESTRRAMEDLFAFHMKNNNPIEALKLYMRGIRDHCTQFKHMAEMWLNWMEASFVAKDWIRLDSVTSQAEKFFVEDHSTDEAAQKEQNRRYPPAAPTASSTQNLVRQVTQSGYTKTMIYTGLVRLHNDKYSQALDRFLAAKVEFIPSSWVVSHSDIALFITLCALATYSRKHIKTKILANSAARKLLEAEPLLLEALQMFVTSQLGKCLDLLKVYKDKLLLDVFMWQVTDKLFKQIRESFIIKYLQPYAVAYMAPMAEAIRVTPSELENELLRLCERGLINVRIDALNGCVSKPMDNHKKEALENVNETYTQLANRCQSLILRTHIQQAHIAITMDRETRNKRKTNTASDDANENQPIRGRMMHGMMKAFRTSKNSAQQPSSPAHPNVAASSSAQNHSEADSSEGSDEPREPLS